MNTIDKLQQNIFDDIAIVIVKRFFVKQTILLMYLTHNFKTGYYYKKLIDKFLK